VYPIAPVVDGNTAEIADDPNTFSEANGDSFSLQNLMELEVNLSLDDLDELLCGFSPSSLSDPDVSESLPDNPSNPDGSEDLPDRVAVALASYDTVPGVFATDPTGPALLPTQGVNPDPNNLFLWRGCFISNCRFCVATDLKRGGRRAWGGVFSDALIHVCDKLWVVTNVYTKQKYTEISMRSAVYPTLLQIANTLDPVNGVRNVVDEDGQVSVFSPLLLWCLNRSSLVA
jgi:hypothetical protein